MKKLLAILLILSLTCVALAETMQVVNCQEWVSLRAQPSKDSNRVAKVPLGAQVTNCIKYNSEFTYCEYEGKCGYILSTYLAETAAAPVSGIDTSSISITELLYSDDLYMNDYSGSVWVLATHAYTDECEILKVGGYDVKGSCKWAYTVTTSYVTELDLTEVFIAGTADKPRVAIYSAEEGLMLINSVTGERCWTLSTVSLGASITHCVDADGTMYITGYYGPDPVAVSIDGAVLWQSSTGNNDIFWPYEMDITEGELEVDYASGYTVRFGLYTGQALDVSASDIEEPDDLLEGTAWIMTSGQTDTFSWTAADSGELYTLYFENNLANLYFEYEGNSETYTDVAYDYCEGSMFDGCPNDLWYALLWSEDSSISRCVTVYAQDDADYLVMYVKQSYAYDGNIGYACTKYLFERMGE